MGPLSFFWLLIFLTLVLVEPLSFLPRRSEDEDGDLFPDCFPAGRGLPFEAGGGTNEDLLG